MGQTGSSVLSRPPSLKPRTPRARSVRIAVSGWTGAIDPGISAHAIRALEAGMVVVLPHAAFPVGAYDEVLMDQGMAPDGRKNVSFDPNTGRVHAAGEYAALAKRSMERFSAATEGLVRSLLAHYAPHIRLGLASFRPAEIEKRTTSTRHDDRLLHIDAFPSRPTGGARILRLFTNLPTSDKPRIWNIGGDFEDVAAYFLPTLPSPSTLSARFSALLGLTKPARTRYDQMMLSLHDRMKRDTAYQERDIAETIRFDPGMTWLYFGDQVPHAALSGRQALEQTFYLPIEAMVSPDTAPLRVLERLTGYPLA